MKTTMDTFQDTLCGRDDAGRGKQYVEIPDRFTYRSRKGFMVAKAKLEKYCLMPGTKHADEFFAVGYTNGDSDLLFTHMEECFDFAKRVGEREGLNGSIQFHIPMPLGVHMKQVFTTAWQIDRDSDEPRLITAYRDRRVKGE